MDGVTSTAAELNLLDGGTSVGSSITLADADGIIVNDGGTMKTIPASDISTYAGGGKVLQVVGYAATDYVNTTSTSYVQTGMTADITPAAVTSKILAIYHSQIGITADSFYLKVGLHRDGADLQGGDGAINIYIEALGGGQDHYSPAGHHFLDSPSSTSALTYEVYIKTTVGEKTAMWNPSQTKGSLTLIEIGA